MVDFVVNTLSYARAVLLQPASSGGTKDFNVYKGGVVDFVGEVIQETEFALIPGLCQ